MKKVKSFLPFIILVVLLEIKVAIIFFDLVERLGFWKSLSVALTIITFSVGVTAIPITFLLLED